MNPIHTIDPLHYSPAESAEYRKLRMLLKAMGLLQDRRMDELWREADQRLPGFADFQRAFPDFPMLLRYREISHRDGDGGGQTLAIHWQQMALSPGKSAILQHYRQLQHELAAARGRRAVGMIFPGHRQRGGMVLHDSELPPAGERLSLDGAGGVVHVERFASLLRALAASHWQVPARSGPAEAAAQEPPAGIDPGGPIPRELLSRCRTPAAAVVLDILWRIQGASLQGEQCRWIQRRDGLRYVVIAQAELSRLTAQRRGRAYSTRAVQKAVRDLLEQGCLMARRGLHGGVQGYRIPTEPPPQTSDPNLKEIL